MEETTSIRESLEAAFEEKEQAAPEVSQEAIIPDSEPASPEPQPEVAPTAEAAPETSVRDEVGRFAKQKEEGITPGPKSEPKPAKEERAPQSWKPETRQHWQTLPPDVRGEIARREGEFTRVLQETAESRRFSDAVMKTIEPYQMFIKAENSNPIQAIDNMMSTAARLRTGTAPEIAGLVSQIVTQFGVGRFGPQFIEALDQALVGQQPRQDPRETEIRRQLEQEIAPVKQFMNQFQQMQQMQEQQMQTQVAGDVNTFLQQNEFGLDVKDDMADLLEMARRRGREMTLEEAYDRATRAHPSIGKIIAKRDQAQVAQGQNQIAQRARSASVSVSGAPSSGIAPAHGDDLRAALENAWGSAGR